MVGNSFLLVQTSMQLKQQQDMALIKTVRLIITLTVRVPKFFMNQYPKQFVVSVIAMQSVKIGAMKLTLIIKKEAKNQNKVRFMGQRVFYN